MVDISLNGRPAKISTEHTVLDLLNSHALRADEVVVEINEKIVVRDRFQATRCAAGDKIEILHFVGGG